MTESPGAGRAFLLSVASGLLLTAAFPKMGFSVVAWIALIPFLLAVRNRSPVSALRLGFVTGLAHFLTLCYWVDYTMRAYGGLGLWVSVPVLFLMASYLALYPAAYGYVVARWCRGPVASLWMLPALWVVMEFGRASLFSGFPWGLLGHSQHAFLPLIQIADTLGVYGVSFLVVLVNVALFWGWLYFTKSTWQKVPITARQALGALSAALVLVALVLIYGRFQIEKTDAQTAKAPKVDVAVVQGNIDQSVKWDPAYQIATIKKYLALSERAMASKPQLVVWPETAIPFLLLQNRPLSKLVIDGIRRIHTDFLVGSPTVSSGDGRRNTFNSLYLITADGRVAERYDKAKLVPFGEYVPFKRWLPFLGKMVAEVGDFTPGRVGATLSWQGHTLGPQICYEIIFSPLARALVRNKAELIVNVTNDAWYGRTSAPYQFFAMVVFRAVETRRAVVRAANTGISGFIDPVGRIGHATPIFTDAVAAQRLPLLNATTAYVRWGDFFAWVCLVAAVATAVLKKVLKAV